MMLALSRFASRSSDSTSVLRSSGGSARAISYMPPMTTTESCEEAIHTRASASDQSICGCRAEAAENALNSSDA